MKKSVLIKKLYISLISLIISLVVLTTAVLGWFVVSVTPKTNEFFISVTSGDVSSTFYLGDDTITGNTLELTKALPGDFFNFKINITNKSDYDKHVKVTFYEVIGEFTYDNNKTENLINILGKVLHNIKRIISFPRNNN